MTHVDALLKGNWAYVDQFSHRGLPVPPARHTAVLTCMDARIDPLAALGASLGELHVIRNAGGRATEDAIRSLVISEQFLGTTEVLVLHHVDCGMLTFSNADVHKKLREALGSEAESAAAQIDFLPFSDLEKSVRDDVETIRRSPLIPDTISVLGALYDVNTGRVSVVSD